MNTKTKITIIISAIIIALISILYAIKSYSDPQAVWSRHKAEQEAKIAQNEREIASLRAERIELQRLDDTLSGSINELKEENTKIKNCLDHGVLQCEKVEKGLSFIPRVSAGTNVGTSNGGAIVVNGTAHSTPESGSLVRLAQKTKDRIIMAFQIWKMEGKRNYSSFAEVIKIILLRVTGEPGERTKFKPPYHEYEPSEVSQTLNLSNS